jgi:hypothetical protein
VELLRAELKRKGYNVTDMDLVVGMLVNCGLKYLENGRLTNRLIKNINNPFDLCTPNGPISPATCVYYDEW